MGEGGRLKRAGIYVDTWLIPTVQKLIQHCKAITFPQKSPKVFQGPAQTALGVGSPPFTAFPHSPPFSLLSAPKADLQRFSGFQQGSDSRGPWAGGQGREERRAGVLVPPCPRFLPAGFYMAPSVTHPARSHLLSAQARVASLFLPLQLQN